MRAERLWPFAIFFFVWSYRTGCLYLRSLDSKTRMTPRARTEPLLQKKKHIQETFVLLIFHDQK